MGILDETLRHIINYGNKIIAEFDGWIQDKSTDRYEKPNWSPRYLEELSYNKSWDDIMPVCKKWGQLNMYGEWELRTERLNLAVLTYDINKVYPVLRDNIIWYNGLKK